MILSLSYYIKKIFIKEKQKKIVGKWNDEGFDRLNLLIDKTKEKRNSKEMKIIKEKILQKYILQADATMEKLKRDKRKREIEDNKSMEKKTIIRYVINVVELWK